METKTLPQGRFDAFYNDWGGGVALWGWVIGSPGSDVGDVVLSARLFNILIGEALVSGLKAKARERFTIHCSERIAPTDIVSGRLRLRALGANGYEIEVSAAESLLTWMAKVAFNQNVVGFLRDQPSVRFVLERIEEKFGPDILKGRSLEAPGGRIQNAKHELTSLRVQAGTISADRTAVIARGGNLLLYEGSNALNQQYQETSLTPQGAALAVQWQRVISRRAREFRRAGIAFLQIIIPEKSSVLAHHYPFPATTPTRLFDAIESWAKTDSAELGSSFVSIFDSFQSDPNLESLYLKTDSHFAALGAMATMRIILESLSVQDGQISKVCAQFDSLMEKAASIETAMRVLSGDLALRFFGVPLYEEDFDLEYEFLFGRASTVKLSQQVIPSGRSLNGNRLSWYHRDAPIKLCVVAFGNSFFERGANCTQLSWWFKHLFEEFHISWSKDVDFEYVDQVKPDIVIAQTIERFLPTVATD